MRRVVAAAAFPTLLLALAAAPARAAAQADCPGADTPYTTDAALATQALLCMVNAERGSRGLAPLTEDVRLDAAAQSHVDDMVAHGYFDHTAPDGSTPLSRAAAGGYGGDVSETLYQVDGNDPDPTPRAPMTAWMRSQEHCSALLSPQLRDFGAGMARGGGGDEVTYTWALELGVGSGPDPQPGGPCPVQSLVTPPGPAPLSGGSVGAAPLTLTLSHNATRFSLHCPSDSAGTCRGTARLTSRGHTLGHARLRIARGRSKVIRIAVDRTSDARATLRLTVNGQVTKISVLLKS